MENAVKISDAWGWKQEFGDFIKNGDSAYKVD
jgi:hypothetical protein